MEAIANFFVSTGFYQFFQGDNWKCAIMLLIAVVLLFLGIVRKFEPLLLVPIAAGCLLDLQDLPAAEVEAQWWPQVAPLLAQQRVLLHFASGERWLRRPWHRWRVWRRTAR